ncbi:MAG: lanthionine synthetase LanC family protein, partial [bacterium]
MARDELVQWCHGAPGHIFLLLRAHEVFKEDSYLELAKISSQSTIFNRGLLRKGVGLCHG